MKAGEGLGIKLISIGCTDIGRKGMAILLSRLGSCESCGVALCRTVNLDYLEREGALTK